MNEHIESSIARAPLSTDPGPHTVVNDLLPLPAYKMLLAAIPPQEQFDAADAVKADFDPVASKLAPSDSVAFWQYFTEEIVGGIITPALLQRFAPCLDAYYKQTFGPFAAAARELELVTFRSRLMLRRPGYRLKPHRDTKIVVITGLLYFAREGDDAAYGTDLFSVTGDQQASFMKTFYPEKHGGTATHARSVPFIPNTALAFLNVPGMAHGANFPKDSTQVERYTFQFYIGPREPELVALVQHMPSAQRAMWASLPAVEG